MNFFSKLTDNLLIPIVLQIAFGFATSQVSAHQQCIDLFTRKPPSNSAFHQSFLDSRLLFLPTYSFRQLFSYDKPGIINYGRSGQNFKTQLASIPNDLRLLRSSELEQLIKFNDKQSIPIGRTTELWSALIVLNPDQGIPYFANHLRSNTSKVSELVDIAEFVQAFDSALAENLAKEILKDYETLNKASTRNDRLLSPKRSALLMSKLLMQWPKKLKATTRNGSIRFGDFESHLNHVRKLTDHDTNDTSIGTARQVGITIKIFQEQLKNWLAQNPDHPSNASIVVTGSFANGLPTSIHSDIDVVIFDQKLRASFFSGFKKFDLQRLINQALNSDGYTGPELPLSDVVEAVHRFTPNYFYNQQKAVEHGFLGTLSFQVFQDHVELIIHDQPTLENNHALAEKFLTE